MTTMGTKSRLYTLAKQAMANLTDADILESPEFSQYLQDTSKNIIAGTGEYLRRQGYAISDGEIQHRASTQVQIVNSEIPNDGWTDGMKISINLNGAGFSGESAILEKIQNGYATTIHEDGHILFTDFGERNKWRRNLEKSIWYPKAPENYEGSFLQAVFDCNNKYVTEILNDIRNCIEDGFIENELSLEFPGTVKQVLRKKVDEMFDEVTPFDEHLDGAATILAALHNQILVCAKSGKMKLGQYNGPCLLYLEEIKKEIESARYDRNFLNRLTATNAVGLLFFECVKIVCGDKLPDKNQMPEQPQSSGSNEPDDSGSGNSSDSEESSGEGGNDSQGGNPSGAESGEEATDNGTKETFPKDIEDILKQLISSILESRNEVGTEISSCGSRASIFGPAKQDGAFQNSLPVPSGDSANKNASSGDEGNSKSGSGEDADTAMASLLQRLKKEISERIAEESLEKERLRHQQAEAKDVTLHRNPVVTQEYIAEYNRLASNALPVSRKLQRGILELFQTRREGSTNRNLFMGKRFEANKVVNRSGRYFMKRNLPTERPKLRVDVLVDTSGSTEGMTIYASILTCIAVEDFCRNLGVANRIMSYASEYSRCDCTLLVEPEKITNTDKYRIVGMRACGGTPTLTAVRFALNSLYDANEEYKLLIVITDGTGSDNHGDALKQEVKKAKRRGISVVAAGIGSCKKGIEYEFGEENFMDISDLGLMPKKLCSLIKRMMPL